jgi:hypothetical protein
LDLKEHAALPDSTTAESGGLVLPRVRLVSRTTLQPFIETSDLEWLTANQPQTRTNHIGLMVYNLTNNANFHAGIYIWTGPEWKPLAVASAYIYLPTFKLPWVTNGSINLYEDVYKENLNPSVAGHYASSRGMGSAGLVAFPDYGADANDFYYVVTYYDPSVITISSITPTGVMTYSKVGSNPAPPENAYINVVLIRK